MGETGGNEDSSAVSTGGDVAGGSFGGHELRRNEAGFAHVFDDGAGEGGVIVIDDGDGEGDVGGAVGAAGAAAEDESHEGRQGDRDDDGDDDVAAVGGEELEVLEDEGEEHGVGWVVQSRRERPVRWRKMSSSAV